MTPRREKFEQAEWKCHPKDGMAYVPEAEPTCKRCAGMGILDDTSSFSIAFIPMLCPDCWKEER